MFIREIDIETEHPATVFVQLCTLRKNDSVSSLMLSSMIVTDPVTVVPPAIDEIGLVTIS